MKVILSRGRIKKKNIVLVSVFTPDIILLLLVHICRVVQF